MDSNVHVNLGDDAKYAVKGEEIVSFQLESEVCWMLAMCFTY